MLFKSFSLLFFEVVLRDKALFVEKVINENAMCNLLQDCSNKSDTVMI